MKLRDSHCQQTIKGSLLGERAVKLFQDLLNLWLGEMTEGITAHKQKKPEPGCAGEMQVESHLHGNDDEVLRREESGKQCGQR